MCLPAAEPYMNEGWKPASLLRFASRSQREQNSLRGRLVPNQ